MGRRLLDALTLNIAAAMTFHTLALACRYIEARHQAARDGLSAGHIESVLADLWPTDSRRT